MSDTLTREFVAFPKISRLTKQTMVITEKIDGTNAAVVITPEGDIYAQSRKRIIVPGDDNFGFAAWVEENREDLLQLGPGRHFGEWWGLGIQRGYGLDHKRFSLFNTHRWSDERGDRPSCCHVVPELHVGLFDPWVINDLLGELVVTGSVAAPGFDNPEGVMVFLPELGAYVKHPYDPNPKGQL